MRKITIDTRTSGYKLFRFVKKILPQFKNSDIFKLIRKKRIKINNKKVSQDYILQEGDIVTLFLQDKYFNSYRKDKFHSVKQNFTIIYEDKNVLVVNKPIGLLIHPDKLEYKNTLSEMIKKYLYSKGEYNTDETFSPASCNRLDRNTSGIVIFAKNHATLQAITKMFRERKVKKEYFAVVHGKLDKKALLVSKIDSGNTIVSSSPLTIFMKIPNKQQFITKQPEYSMTVVTPIKVKNNYSIVKVDLWTGKKHQIRIHLKEYNHPLIGDYKYFTPDSKRFSKDNNIQHYYLHCYCIEVPSYDTWISHPIWNTKDFIF